MNGQQWEITTGTIRDRDQQIEAICTL